MNQEYPNISKTIRDYTNRCGGEVSVEDLVHDFKIAYKYDIPFQKLGFTDLVTFLSSISGIKLTEQDGVLCLCSLSQKKITSKSPESLDDDLSKISIKMTTNLRLRENPEKRTVTMRSNTEQSNLRSRKLILENMSNYSNERNDLQTEQIVSSSSSEYSLHSESSSHSLWYEDSIPNNVFEVPYSVSTPEENIVDNDTFGINTGLNFFNESSNSLLSNAFTSYKISPYYISLMDLVALYNLDEPEFETLDNYTSDDVKYTTILKIGNENFISPMYTNVSSFHIYEDLLKTAYESLKNKYDQSKKFDAVTQIIEIIDTFTEGVDIDAIETVYIKKHRVCPPRNWTSLIENSSLLYCETLPTGFIIYPRRTFNTLIPHSSDLPAQLIPSSSTSLNVHITNCLNTNSVWFRILENYYIAKYQTLFMSMKKHYESFTLSDLRTADIGELYACYYQENWCRVEVLSKKNDVVECRLLESGIIEEFVLNVLFPLDQKFTNTPPMAFCGSMTGLEKYSPVKYVSCNLRKMLQNELATVKLEPASGSLSVNIYLKNRVFDVNVNQYILNKIRKEFHPPRITVVNELFDVYLISIEKSGCARVQIESDSLQLLKQSLHRASQIIDQDGSKRRFYVTSILKLKTNKVYLTKENTWKRIMIKKVVNVNTVNVLFIDTGEEKNVEINNIVCDDAFPDTLLHIAPQVIDIQVIQRDLSKNLVQFLSHICLQNLHCLKLSMKVLNINQNPVVELHKKLLDEKIIPLETLMMNNCDHIISANFVNNLNNILPSELCFDLFGETERMANSTPIPTYELSKGDILKVSVLKVLSPSQFIIKLESQPDFANLMVTLNNYHLIFSPEPEATVVIGRIYAVKLENGFWYRGLALYVMQDLKSVIIKLLDFAETVSVPLSAVYALSLEFCCLPAQTITAKLWGIEPIQGEWTSDDNCRFKQLVYLKTMECVVVENRAPSYQVILLDCSKKPDMVNISSFLINERRAINAKE